MKFSGYTLDTQAIIYSQFFSLHNCTFKSEAIYYITLKCNDSVKTSRLCNNFAYSFFSGKSESIYLKVPCILDITEKECENDEEMDCSSSITTSKTG